ncbi:MAG: TlpA family protein disulfide reductase [Bacteroidaceae bacterium]|nr:TlpA family protein disulfide reductase [Bacteroidaceae bacterium]
MNNTKWRNEETGDWDIGFFEKFAVYDCKFWQYESVNEKRDKYDIALRYNNDLLTIKVGKEKKGKRDIQIGQKKPQQYSNITSHNMPYYPQSDASPELIDNGYSRIDTITIVGWLKDMPENERAVTAFELFFDNIFQNGQSVVSGEIDSIGRFIVKAPVINSHELFLRHGSTSISTVFETGETYFLLHDFKSNQQMFMGRKSMLQNMYLAHQDFFGRIAPTIFGGPQHGPYSSYDEFFKDSEKFWANINSNLDSLIKEHPTLSPKYTNYMRNFWNIVKAERLAQAGDYLPDHKLPKAALDEIVEKYWKHLPRPYTAYCGEIFRLRIHLLQQFMMRRGFDVTSATFNSIMNDRNLNIPASYRETIKQYLSVVDDFLKKTEGMNSQEEIQKVGEAFLVENQSLMQEMQALMADAKMNDLITERNFCISMDFPTVILDSIGSDRDMKDFFVGLNTSAMISGSNHSLSPAMMEMAEKRISLPIVIDGLRELNKKYLDFENKDQQSIQSTGMSMGESLFRKFTEPYKGKIILVDFWGTWCVPCMQALSKSQEEYKRLSPYDIVYMYFANNSPEAKWKEAIEQNQIKGDNVVHFNLEPTEQKAIEQFFQVNSFPSYYLIDKEGRLLPFKVDARDLDALEDLIKRIRVQNR